MPASGQASASKDVARERLKIVLVQDRAEANRGFLEKIKRELIEVVGRYADLDPGSVEVKVSRSDRESILVARFPLRSLRRTT
ncbi:MAG: cell division topological specificity factor MinE [Bacillota bacterium]|jgi:cell division topological specificity factor